MWIRLSYVMGMYWGFGDLFTGLQIMTILVLGTVEAVNGNISVGTFMAFISYNATLVWPIRSLGRVLSEMSKAGVSIDRINYILEEEEEQDDPAGLTPDLHGDIVFDHVNFAYEGLMPILKDIHFTIKAGSTFAILGGTGSGKSTLMHLLDRLYELPKAGGTISIGGVDISAIRLSYLRENIGMVLQEPFLVFPYHSGKHQRRPARRGHGGNPSRIPHCQCRRCYHGLFRRLRYHRGRARRNPVRRTEAAGSHRPYADAAGAHYDF